MQTRGEAQRALDEALEKAGPELSALIDAELARGAPLSDLALLVFDAESPFMTADGGAALFAAFPRVAGRYIVAPTTVDVAAKLARDFADMADADQDAAEREVRRIAGLGGPVVLAHAGEAFASFRRVTMTIAGQA